MMWRQIRKHFYVLFSDKLCQNFVVLFQGLVELSLSGFIELTDLKSNLVRACEVTWISLQEFQTED